MMTKTSLYEISLRLHEHSTCRKDAPMIFLAFEGLDGSGKSTLMKQLESYLASKKMSFIHTREPGGSFVGDQLRSIILAKSSDGKPAPTARTELLLYEASRAQHVDLVIRPALQEKKWVLCDRFTASSIAFQAGGRKISTEQVEWLNRFATDGVEPHLNILLDLTVEESKNRRLQRQNQDGQTEDRMESEVEAFHQRVRLSFLAQAQLNAQKWLVIDASQTPEQIFQVLLKALKVQKWLD